MRLISNTSASSSTFTYTGSATGALHDRSPSPVPSRRHTSTQHLTFSGTQAGVITGTVSIYFSRRGQQYPAIGHCISHGLESWHASPLIPTSSTSAVSVINLGYITQGHTNVLSTNFAVGNLQVSSNTGNIDITSVTGTNPATFSNTFVGDT